MAAQVTSAMMGIECRYGRVWWVVHSKRERGGATNRFGCGMDRAVSRVHITSPRSSV